MLYLLFALIDRWLAPVPRAGRCDWLTTPVYAHRGFHDAASGRIENSPGAFAAAIAAGLGIECDVQRSRDGQAVVFHDEDLSRLTGKPGRVADETAASLAQVVLTGSADTIPLLATLLAQIAGRVPLLIEVKIARAGRVQPLCLAVNRALEGYGGQVAVMSFDPRVCSWFHHYSPHVVRGLVMTEASWRTLGAKARRHLALWRARPDFMAYDIGDIGGAFPVAQRRRGMPLLTWTVDNMEKAARAGAKADAPIAEGAGLAQLLGAQ
ncbi:glycerophosphodiester phosphodiesterase family protein [Novosphingobium sp.]|uniref:glycerophosphodiester phosphodiesterase family protein n=1 Tax=Novosphingobium sp. TaxID=1874826 RepID=UPI003B519A11